MTDRATPPSTHLKVLRQRFEFVRGRAFQFGGHRDRAETAALAWALPILQEFRGGERAIDRFRGCKPDATA